jgi:hypothetical protein
MKQELDNLNLPFMAKSAGPAWLPVQAVESRNIAWWSQWVIGLWGVLLLITGLVSFLTVRMGGGLVYAGYALISGVLCFILLYLLKSWYFDVLDQGKFKEAADKLILLALLGFLPFLIPGAMLLLAYLRLNDIFQPNYEPYPEGTYQAGTVKPPQVPPPPASQAPMPEPSAQSDSESHKKAEMVKCKKCGVQYPTFMRTCPNCNEPR